MLIAYYVAMSRYRDIIAYKNFPRPAYRGILMDRDTAADRYLGGIRYGHSVTDVGFYP